MRALLFGLIVASVSVSESRADFCRTFNGPPWDAAPIYVHPGARPEAPDSPLRGGKEVVQRWNPVSDPSGIIWVHIYFRTWGGLKEAGWMREVDLCPRYYCGVSYDYRRRYRY
jgi:hypothetical protein